MSEFLYHGTSARYLNSILRHGLKPRSASARNNWKHVPHQSNPRCVYLTNSYAPYFAHNACRIGDDAAIIEVAFDRLDDSHLFPDEDFLEQVMRGRDDLPDDMSMSRRTLYYRKRQFEYDQFELTGNPDYPLWYEASLAFLGTCAYRGIIPPSTITRVVTYPYKENIRLHFTWDPTITIINQEICGYRYRELTCKLFAGEFMTVDENTPLNERFTALPPVSGWKVTEVNP